MNLNEKALSKKREAAGHPAFESDLRNLETGMGTTVFLVVGLVQYKSSLDLSICLFLQQPIIVQFLPMHKLLEL